tara:strand:+ start:349 stop:1437 length:1089 start_codon:yes stop_codon:yes gene_type:complete
MKNILKTIAVLVSSSLISLSAVAGELSVTGSATATYVISGGKNNDNKGIGISNELMFSASGELDNGFTWKYHTELDMADGGAASNDDTAVVFGLNDLGTLGIYDAEGGLSTETGYGIGAVGVGQDYANTMTRIGMGTDVSADPHIAYSTPADLLPFGLSASVGYAPNTSDGQGNSAKSTGGSQTVDADGTNATQYRLTASPIDGLKLGADFYEVGNDLATLGQAKTSGHAYAQYAMGNFKVGIFDAYLEPGIATKYGTASADTATASNGDRYDFKGIGIEFAVNDAMSVSYSQEKYKRIDKTMSVTQSTHVESSVEAEADYIQVAYNIGGATLGLAMVDTDNSDYTANKEESKTVFSIALEF